MLNANGSNCNKEILSYFSNILKLNKLNFITCYNQLTRLTTTATNSNIVGNQMGDKAQSNTKAELSKTL